MASNHGGKDVMDCGSSEGNSSETTVEIKIKTLDSQTYTLRVDKCVPVPDLKEQIATVTGVLSDQQRLICRGKVLKDDQLLSAYHVEDGHTLHLVARQPIDPSLASFSDHTASDPTSNTGHTTDNESGHRVVVGTFDISGQGDGGIPDISRIVSAVLGSFGVANAGNGGEAVDLQEHVSERLSRIPGLGDLRNFTTQPENASGRGQATSLPADVSVESLQAPVIPDSLTTLSQYLRRLRQEFNSNARSQGNSSQVLGSPESAGQDSNATPPSAARQGGLPTPAALAEVTESTRQLFIDQAGECLTQLTRQLGNQNNVTDSVARTRMQSNALRSGALLQNLGSFLLELGRTTMTLRMGQTSTDAVVNAGPAVFISTSGPNPIMVQPLPFQPGTSFGTPVGSGASFSVGSGSGSRPRNIDIRIRTGSLLSSAVNPRETSAEERSARTDPAVSDQAAPRNLPPTRESDVRVVPIRISTISPVIAHSDSSRSSMGILYPALARAQHVDSGGIRGQAADGTRPPNGDSRPQPATHLQHSEVLGASGTTQTDGGQTFAAEIHGGVDQLLSNLFTRDENNASDFIFQGMSTNPVSFQGMNTNPVSADVQQDSQSVSADGMFLSNLLHQIMPIVSRNLNGANGSSGHGIDVGDGATQPSSSVENQDRGASSRQSDDHASPPTSKRQKRE